MAEELISQSRILAEVLRIQKWAAGEAVADDRLFGLLHGFETTIQEEADNLGVSRLQQDAVEGVLNELDQNPQSVDGLWIKETLRRIDVDELVAARVLEMCLLQSRFIGVINSLVKAEGSPFATLRGRTLPTTDWSGSLHFIELVDCSGSSRTPLHATFSPNVPRVGEIVIPEKGQRMKVVGVEYLATRIKEDSRGLVQLVPHVLLEPADDESPERE